MPGRLSRTHAATSCQGQLHVWRRQGRNMTLEPQQSIPAHASTIHCIRFAGGAGTGGTGPALLISASADRAIKIWTIAPSRIPSSRKPPAAGKEGVDAGSAPDPQESPVLTCLRTLHGHSGGIKGVDCVGDLIVSVDIHGFVRLWHIASGNVLLHLALPDLVARSSGTLTVSPSISPASPPTESARPTGSPTTNSSTSTAATGGTAAAAAARHLPLACVHFTEGILSIGTFAGAVLVFRVQGPPAIPDSELANAPPGSSSSVARQYRHLLDWAKRPDSLHFLAEYALDPGKGPTSSAFFTSPTTTTAGREEGVGAGIGVGGGGGGGHNAWVLSVKHDSWRVLAAGSEGWLSMWNHWAAQRVYSLVGTDILHGDGGRGRLEPVPWAPGFTAAPALSSATSPSPLAIPGLKAITSVDLNDEHIVACCMDGKVHIWEAL